MDSPTEPLDIAYLIERLDTDDFTFTDELSDLNAYQWAHVLEALTNEHRLKVWPSLKADLASTILAEMREDARNQLVTALPQKDIESAISTGSNLEVVEIFDVLPNKTVAKLVNKLSPECQNNIKTSLSYSDEEVGRYASPNVYTINASACTFDVLEEIKSTGLNNESEIYIVVDDELTVLGEVLMSDLLNHPDQTTIMTIARPVETTIIDEQSLLEASNLVKTSQRNSLPVVTKDNKLIGLFSLYDALNVFQDHYEAQIAHMGQVSDEDLFAPVLLSARRRAVWLGINLVTAFLASFVIGIFDKVLVEVVALAVLMPIVASMGGITGSQTLTLTIRGLATGQLGQGNYNVLRNKELKVALINGVIWALMVAAITLYWFDNNLLSLMLGMSLVINMTIASLAGILIPITLDKMKIDPALAGSVILTTVTDVVGFLVFLGSATVVFLN